MLPALENQKIQFSSNLRAAQVRLGHLTGGNLNVAALAKTNAL
jgi:hypothetical protein